MASVATGSLSLRAFTGVGAGTESSAQTTVTLTDADDLSAGTVAPGTRSFERWVALRVDSAPALGVANFWFEATGDLPAGVEIRFGVTDTPATPVATASAVATREFQADRRYIFDVNTYAQVGDHTRYLVLQEIVAADADPDTLNLDWQFGWVAA